ncbi:MAG: Uma2 family endonuclease [Deltaproteobacteria bacterium]|nr:Uma2 family endonuclease [Deltaproteobacteria bacterium]
MTPGTPAAAPYTAARFFALVDEGVLCPDDRVELLEGVIVSMSPQNPRHASAVRRVAEALRTVVGEGVVVSVQLPLVVSERSVPEPDVAIVPGVAPDYDTAHPTTALLVVEVADTSLMEDRLTKAAIYAAAGIPAYWIVNLRDDVVETFGDPDTGTRRYGRQARRGRGQRLEHPIFHGATVAVDDVLPGRG